jgi:hypothetical protein
MSTNGQVSGLSYSRVEGGVLYGPPRSRRGRLLNRLRRLVGRDERADIYATSVRPWPDGVDFDSDTIRVVMTSSGLFTVDDE